MNAADFGTRFSRAFRNTLALQWVTGIEFKAAAVISATLLIYWQDFAALMNESLNSDLTRHILLMPLLIGYLVYRKRKQVSSLLTIGESPPRQGFIYSNALLGLLLVLVALTIQWYGNYSFTPLEVHLLSLPVFLTGVLLFMTSLAVVRVLAFPILFTLMILPPPEEVSTILGAILTVQTTQLAHAMLKLLGLPVRLDLTGQAPTFAFSSLNGEQVNFVAGVPCSGLYSLVGFASFALFTAYIMRAKLWAKGILFAAGFIFVYFLNIVRVSTIIYVGYRYGLNAAVETFHLFGGMVMIFLGTLLLLVIGDKAFGLELFAKSFVTKACKLCAAHLSGGEQFCLHCGRQLRALRLPLAKMHLVRAGVLFLLLLLAVPFQLPIFAFTAGPASSADVLGVQGAAPAAANILPRVSAAGLKWEPLFLFRDRNFERLAEQDASLLYSYVPVNASFDTSRFTVLLGIEIAKPIGHLHRWEYCLIEWPAIRYLTTNKLLDVRDVTLSQNPPLIGRFVSLILGRTNQTQVVLYWYTRTLFRVPGGFQQEYVKISVVGAVDTEFLQRYGSYVGLENFLLEFGLAIVAFWVPLQAASLVASGIGQGQAIVASSLATIMVGGVRVSESFSERKVRSRFYSKLSMPEDKLVLRALQKARRKGIPTAANVTSEYSALLEEAIDPGEMVKKLALAEHSGLVRRSVFSYRDEPILAWITPLTSNSSDNLDNSSKKVHG